jgi:hypothetical protein
MNHGKHFRVPSLAGTLALVCVGAAVACGEGTPVPSASGGTGGGAEAGRSSVAGAAGTAGAGAMSGGAPPSAGSGGVSGTAGTASAGVSNGGGAGTSGSGGAGAGGLSPGGASSSGNAGVGGSAGSAGSGSLESLAMAFDGFRLECPCIDANHFGQDKEDNCDNAPAVDRQTHAKKLGGEPGVIYDVKLRVRGNTEPNTYTGGKLEQKYFYTGGQTSTPGYTAYMLSVEDPKQVYFFNYSATTGHFHFLIDYEVVIPMRGGTTATFEVNGGKSVPDGHGVSNREGTVVPDVPPAPEPFNGQLVQFDVVSVTPHAM